MKILLCLFWLACANDTTPPSQSTVPLEISVQDLYPISTDALIIDVRTPGEFNQAMYRAPDIFPRFTRNTSCQT